MSMLRGINYIIVLVVIVNIAIAFYALSTIKAEVQKHDAYFIGILHKYCPLGVYGMKVDPPPFNVTWLNQS